MPTPLAETLCRLQRRWLVVGALGVGVGDGQAPPIGVAVDVGVAVPQSPPMGAPLASIQFRQRQIAAGSLFT
jgi:hypothetical protein